MVTLKLWFDARFRFYICISVMIVFALLLIGSYIGLNKTLSQSGPGSSAKISESTRADLNKVVGNYALYIDMEWFTLAGGLITLLAIIMALQGPLAESHSVHLTLSLPVRRYRWCVTQGLLTLGLIVAILLAATSVLWVAGALAGHVYPPRQATFNALLCAVPAAAWIGLTLAVGSFTRDKTKTALIAIPAKFISVFLFVLPPIRIWDMSRLGWPMSMQTQLTQFQWRPLLLVVVCAVGGVALTAYRFEQSDY
ncbi:MAG: hypothetical protein ACLQM6_12505 [Acidobacteriaceae bacterium]